MNLLPPITINQLLVGRSRAFGPNGEPSAIDKHRVTGSLELGITGFVEDQQGDRRHHGGIDKAIHHYPADHYPLWRQEFPQIPAERFHIGGFGENLTSLGMTERNVCVGDIYRFGKAVIQVSQARQPCWKLNLRFGAAQMARCVQESGRTGWYYRVLETGKVATGDTLSLLERPHPNWSLAQLLHYLYIEPLNDHALAEIATLAVLPTSWRELAQRRLDTGEVEAWSRRLHTPSVDSGEGTKQ
ncbi:MAG: MOSC domain-containing protein [Gammaproteobacteria bacterium]|nr:MOSC domain-containing protein [Gammaproteobacteria bacterium]